MLTPEFIKNKYRQLKARGVKAFLRENGWKVVMGIVLFYLVRDTIIYIVLPYLLLNNFISCQ